MTSCKRQLNRNECRHSSESEPLGVEDDDVLVAYREFPSDGMMVPSCFEEGLMYDGDFSRATQVSAFWRADREKLFLPGSFQHMIAEKDSHYRLVQDFFKVLTNFCCDEIIEWLMMQLLMVVASIPGLNYDHDDEELVSKVAYMLPSFLPPWVCEFILDDPSSLCLADQCRRLEYEYLYDQSVVDGRPLGGPLMKSPTEVMTCAEYTRSRSLAQMYAENRISVQSDDNGQLFELAARLRTMTHREPVTVVLPRFVGFDREPNEFSVDVLKQAVKEVYRMSMKKKHRGFRLLVARNLRKGYNPLRGTGATRWTHRLLSYLSPRVRLDLNARWRQENYEADDEAEVEVVPPPPRLVRQVAYRPPRVTYNFPLRNQGDEDYDDDLLEEIEVKERRTPPPRLFKEPKTYVVTQKTINGLYHCFTFGFMKDRRQYVIKILDGTEKYDHKRFPHHWKQTLDAVFNNEEASGHLEALMKLRKQGFFSDVSLIFTMSTTVAQLLKNHLPKAMKWARFVNELFCQDTLEAIAAAGDLIALLQNPLGSTSGFFLYANTMRRLLTSNLFKMVMANYPLLKSEFYREGEFPSNMQNQGWFEDKLPILKMIPRSLVAQKVTGVVVGFFSSKFFTSMDISQQLALNAMKQTVSDDLSMISFVTGLFDTLTTVSESVIKYTQTGCLLELFKDETQDYIFLMQKYTALMQCASRSGLADHKFKELKQIEEFNIRLTYNFKKMKEHPYFGRAYNLFSDALVDFKERVIFKKTAPYGLIVTGQPGCGKSILYNDIEQMYKTRHGIETADITIKVLKAGNFEQVPGAACFLNVEDAFGQVDDPKVSSITEFQRYLEADPVGFATASLAEKARSRTQLKFVYASTNAMKYQAITMTSGFDKLDRRAEILHVAMTEELLQWCVEKNIPRDRYLKQSFEPDGLVFPGIPFVYTFGYMENKPDYNTIRFDIKYMKFQTDDRDDALRYINMNIIKAGEIEITSHLTVVRCEHGAPTKDGVCVCFFKKPELMRKYCVHGCKDQCSQCAMLIAELKKEAEAISESKTDKNEPKDKTDIKRRYKPLVNQGSVVSTIKEKVGDKRQMMCGAMHDWSTYEGRVEALRVTSEKLGLGDFPELPEWDHFTVPTFLTTPEMALTALGLLFVFRSVRAVIALIPDQAVLGGVINSVPSERVAVEAWNSKLPPWATSERDPGLVYTYKCRFVSGNDVANMHAMYICANIVVVPKHMFDKCPSREGVFSLLKGKWQDFPIGGGSSFIMRDDMAFIYLPRHASMSNGMYELLEARSGEWTGTFKGKRQLFFETGGIINMKAPGIAGDCGLPYIRDDGSIAGYHIRGNEVQGVGQVLKREHCDSAIAFFSDQGRICLKPDTHLHPVYQAALSSLKPELGVKGDVTQFVMRQDPEDLLVMDLNVVGRLPYKNTLKMTGKATAVSEFFRDRCKTYVTPHTGHALESAGWVSPYTKVINRHPLYLGVALEKGAEYFVNNVMRLEPCAVVASPLTLHQALVGDPRNTFMNGVRTDTSVGPLHNLQKITKSQLFRKENDGSWTMHRAMCERMAEFEEALMRRTAQVTFISATMKDELITEEKRAAGGGRLFYVVEKEANIMIKRYLLPIFSFLAKRWRDTGMVCNINPGSQDWDDLARKHVNTGDYHWEVDMSSYDVSHSEGLSQSAWVFFKVGCLIGYSKEDATKAAMCVEMFLSGYLIMEGFALDVDVRLFSGLFFTLFVNGIIGKMLMYGWLGEELKREPIEGSGKDFVSDHVGDDVISTLNNVLVDKEGLTVESFVKFCARGGYKVTSASKSDQLGFIPFEEMTFLKRTFKYNAKYDRYMGPLALESIYKSMSYACGKAAGTLERDQSAWQSAEKELFLHGPVQFAEGQWRAMKAGLSCRAFEYYESQYLAGELLTWTHDDEEEL